MESMLNQLIKQAGKCTMDIKLAAGLFYTKKGFIGIGSNSSRTYMKKTVKPNIHAEDAVIHYVKTRYGRIKTRDLKLIVIRATHIKEEGREKLLLSKPCMNCTKTIREYGIRKVYYINENGELVCERISRIEMYHEQFPYLTATNIWFHHVYKGNSAVLPVVLQVNQHLKKEEHVEFFTKSMGETIKLLRQERHWDQDELAKRLCLRKSIINNIEEGKKEKYNPYLALKIRKCFGTFIW